MSDSMRPKADDVVPPCMDFENPGPHVWSWRFCKNCGKREPFQAVATRDNSARKDEIAADAERKIGKTVEEWYESGEFDLHARVRGIVVQALTSYEEERTPQRVMDMICPGCGDPMSVLKPAGGCLVADGPTPGAWHAFCREAYERGIEAIEEDRTPSGQAVEDTTMQTEQTEEQLRDELKQVHADNDRMQQLLQRIGALFPDLDDWDTLPGFVEQLHGKMERLSREGWQPIETAPKKAGGEVLLRVKVRAGIPGCSLVGHWMPGGHCIEDHPAIDGGWYFWNGCMFDLAAEPTHWMPLPTPPASSGEGASTP